MEDSGIDNNFNSELNIYLVCIKSVWFYILYLYKRNLLTDQFEIVIYIYFFLRKIP